MHLPPQKEKKWELKIKNQMVVYWILFPEELNVTTRWQ